MHPATRRLLALLLLAWLPARVLASPPACCHLAENGGAAHAALHHEHHGTPASGDPCGSDDGCGGAGPALAGTAPAPAGGHLAGSLPAFSAGEPALVAPDRP
jgi:hypothetical protein